MPQGIERRSLDFAVDLLVDKNCETVAIGRWTQLIKHLARIPDFHRCQRPRLRDQLRIAQDFQPITWQAFRAFVLEEKSATQVAAELGISAGAVWTAKSHVLKRLRQEARDWLD